MVKVFGWWDFDPEAETLINRVTGESVRFIGRLAQKGHWLKFKYEYEGVVFPIFVEKIDASCNDIEYGPHDSCLASDSRMPAQGIVWKVDYIRSVKAWQRESGEDTTYPGYGLWRRVDDCVIDALYFWPERENSGLSPVRVVALGGWLNGNWCADWERVFGYAAKGNHRYLRSDLEDAAPIKKTWLCPLDEPAPSSWKFIGDIAHSEIGSWDFKGWKTLQNSSASEELIEYGNSRFLDDQICLEGFEDKTIYLQTKDKTSVIGYRRGSSNSHHIPPEFEFRYADKSMVGTLIVSTRTSYTTDINAHSSYFFVDYQRPRLFSRLFSQRGSKINWTIKDCRRRLPVIRDAFLFWGGTEYRKTTWDSRLSLKAREWVLFNSSYLGGVAELSVNCAARRLNIK